MSILMAVHVLGPVGFAGFASMVGVVALLVYGAILLSLHMVHEYRRLDNIVKKAGFYGILTTALLYLFASMTLWMSLHLAIGAGIIR
jgi:hypothetical protein